ncbi:MAG: FtsX-like permease family protein [Clostridiaceae bacterium]|nr:FtsX-like permease family protein [Clostridiaceae bacterium]
MKSYLMLVHSYLKAHSKKTRLAVISVAMSVALVTGMFSMVDVFLRFEKLQVIYTYGNYHLAVKDASDEEASIIRNRIDVRNAGRWKDLGIGQINGADCRLGALDEVFAGNMNIEVLQGNFPREKNEVMLEKWAAERLFQGAETGNLVRIAFEDNTEKKFIVSGIYNDLGKMKAEGVPGVMMSASGTEGITDVRQNLFFVEFKSKVRINRAVAEIKGELDIADDRIGLNTHLLSVIGQSEHKAAVGLYTIGAVLFTLVLIAGVVMIYNTFNISVMERVRQFGLLRCVGASKAQIKRLVRKEGLAIALRAIPPGIALGMLMALVCSAILKFYNNTIFGEIPLFSISIAGILLGIAIGFLTVFMASLVPAKKAAGVSPVNAVSGSNEMKISKTVKKGFLSKLMRLEIAMGMNSAFMKKKTLFLMACSIALSIIMFLGFNVFIDFMHTSLKTTKPNTPDISLVSEKGMGEEIFERLSGLDGVKRIYGRKLAYVNASFDVSRLRETYKKSFGEIKTESNGLFVPPEKSWLISYDENQFRWAKPDLLEGELSAARMNEENGVIAVAQNLRNNITTETVGFKLGDKVYIDTPTGKKELTVMGILRQVPFNSQELTLTAFVVTEKVFSDTMGETGFKVIDIQLKNRKDERTVGILKSMAGDGINLLDVRQKNSEINQLFLTMAVFVYGFVAVIAIISILNIINTMNTSVVSKTRYLGVMRAIGMSGRQLNSMVLTEAATYSVIGSAAGAIIGSLLQKILIMNYLSSFNIKWRFPLFQIAIILVLVSTVTVFSVISPLKRIREKGITEIVNSL